MVFLFVMYTDTPLFPLRSLRSLSPYHFDPYHLITSILITLSLRPLSPYHFDPYHLITLSPKLGGFFLTLPHILMY